VKFKSPGRNIGIVGFLLAGFTTLVCLLLATAFVAYQAIEGSERNNARLMLDQTDNIRVINELQREEDALSAVFYALVGRPDARQRAELLSQLDQLSSRVHASTEAGLALGNREDWLKVRRVAGEFITEVRRTLLEDDAPSETLNARHQDLVDALSELSTERYQDAVEAQTRQAARTRTRVRNMLVLLMVSIGIAIPGAVLAIRAAVRMLRTLEWQTQELARLTARTMSVQEETARRFSRELHDQFGQTLTAIEANLVALRGAGADPGRITDCLSLVKDAMANVREISQLLRPSVLDDFGLDASLRWLAETFSQRTGVRVQYTSTFDARLSGDAETQLFRIAQEALTNVARHSEATRVRVDLSAAANRLALTIADNGQGLPERRSETSTGLISMRTRARETGGTLTIRSARGKGVTIMVELPLGLEKDHATEDPHLVGR
jgi:signal transduction histidine kinase